MARSSAGCGWLRLITTVLASGVSMLETGANIVWKGWFSLIVMIEKATSSLVTGLPSWKVAFFTKLSVTERPSSATVQLSAR